MLYSQKIFILRNFEEIIELKKKWMIKSLVEKKLFKSLLNFMEPKMW